MCQRCPAKGKKVGQVDTAAINGRRRPDIAGEAGVGDPTQSVSINQQGPEGRMRHLLFVFFCAVGFFTTTSLLPTTRPITAPNAASMLNIFVLITNS